jgi:hypothetical protein
MSRIDASGRLTSQAISHVLDWRPGDRLTLTADAGAVVVRRDPPGMAIVPARRAVAIPAAPRHRCGLRPGDQVLLAALPREDTRAACTFAVVDQALQARPALPALRGRTVMIGVTPATQLGGSQQAVVEAALVLLERMGLSPADLVAAPREQKAMPTFAAYVPVVSAAVSAGTRRAYGSYWNRHRGGTALCPGQAHRGRLYPAGSPLLAGICGRAATAGVFARQGGTWQLAGPELPAAA